jgi:histidinol-phosphatase (PHP family)
MIKKIRDGHIHSHYCPHGTKDEFYKYIDKALEQGLKEITFTEHLPLPKGFIDKKIIEESAPSIEEIEKYFNEVKEVQILYKDKIKINIGVEVDYIEGLEAKTIEILKGFGMKIEDSILSIHFLKLEDRYHCLDYNKQDFKELIELLGGIDKVYDKYFETLLKSIKVDLGEFKPKRIGHPTLVRIFNLEYPFEYKNKALLEEIVIAIKDKGYEIDYNTAGIRKPYCLEPYPSGEFLELLNKHKVKMVCGSDAHAASDVGKYFN